MRKIIAEIGACMNPSLGDVCAVRTREIFVEIAVRLKVADARRCANMTHLQGIEPKHFLYIEARAALKGLRTERLAPLNWFELFRGS